MYVQKPNAITRFGIQRAVDKVCRGQNIAGHSWLRLLCPPWLIVLALRFGRQPCSLLVVYSSATRTVLHAYAGLCCPRRQIEDDTVDVVDVRPYISMLMSCFWCRQDMVDSFRTLVEVLRKHVAVKDTA